MSLTFSRKAGYGTIFRRRGILDFLDLYGVQNGFTVSFHVSDQVLNYVMRANKKPQSGKRAAVHKGF